MHSKFKSPTWRVESYTCTYPIVEVRRAPGSPINKSTSFRSSCAGWRSYELSSPYKLAVKKETERSAYLFKYLAHFSKRHIKSNQIKATSSDLGQSNSIASFKAPRVFFDASCLPKAIITPVIMRFDSPSSRCNPHAPHAYKNPFPPSSSTFETPTLLNPNLFQQFVSGKPPHQRHRSPSLPLSPVHFTS